VSSYKPNVEENAYPTENDTAHDPSDDQKKLVDDYGQLDKRAIDNMSEQVKNHVKAYLDKNNFISIGGGNPILLLEKLLPIQI
jgi:hypothetical protein